MSIDDERLAGWQRATDAATRGPWRQEYGFNNGGCATGFFYVPGSNTGKRVEMLADDAEFVVVAREAMPLLLAEVARLTAALEAERQRAERLRAEHDEALDLSASRITDLARRSAEAITGAPWSHCTSSMKDDARAVVLEVAGHALAALTPAAPGGDGEGR